jgi:hypothetical protein
MARFARFYELARSLTFGVRSQQLPSNVTMWRILLVGAALAAGCLREGGSQPELRLRGPLVGLVLHPPHSLASCASDSTRFDPPFWRAPYRACRAEYAEGAELLQVDADSVLTQSYQTWRVDRASRDSVFAFRFRETERALGASRECSPWKREWSRGDSLQAVLQVVAESDVGPDDASPTWRITRLMRLGPVDRTTWACEPIAPAI